MLERFQSALQACLIALLIEVLVFPPGLRAANPDQLTLSWNGGQTQDTGSADWSTSDNWSCSNNCPGDFPGTYPNNSNLSSAYSYIATVNTGSDWASLSGNNVTIDGLTLGTGDATTSSRLDVSNASLTLGTANATPDGSVLTINGGGTLNIQTGGTVTLELSAGGVVNNYAGSASNTQGINVTDGGTLTLQNTAGGQSTINNAGNINVTGTSSAAALQLNDSGANSSFLMTGGGTLTLGGLAQITGQTGDETLINDVGHTISGSGSIGNLLYFANNGALNESGGLTISVGTSSISSPENGFSNTGTVTANNNLTFDTTSGGSFYNQSGGTITANDGATLTFRNVSPTGMNVTPNTAVFQNDGIISIGSNPSLSGATLILDSTDGTKAAAGTGTIFDLQSPSGGGTLNLYGNSAIQGQTGTEGLINDYGHSIVATAGSTGSISNLASIANNGTIQVGDVNGPASLTIDTSSDGKHAGSFSNSTYGGINVLDGGTLTLQNTTNKWAVFQNDGVITVGSGTGAALQFNSNGNATNFVLGSSAGSPGLLSLLGQSTVSGVSGAESLLNGYYHTIAVGVDQYGDLIPSNATISGLAKFTNNGTIDVGGYELGPTVSSASASHGADAVSGTPVTPTLTIDTTNPNGSGPGSFSNTYNGLIFVADGSSLAFQNTSTSLPTLNGAPTAVFNNDGLIYLGQYSGATLYLNDGGNGTTFDLTSNKGTGYVIMNGTSAITGVNGTESLINDTGHSINVGVDYCGCATVLSNATISGLAGFTNNGNINVGAEPEFLPATISAQGAVTSRQSVTPTLTIDTTNPNGSGPGSFSNGYNGLISVADGSSLAFQNTSTALPSVNGAPTAVFNNDGLIYLGLYTGATLYLNDGGNGTTFDLTSSLGTGYVIMEGYSTITGVNGTESLINDAGHTIGVDSYASGLISNLASFTNNGSVQVGDPTYPGSYAALTFDTSNGGSFYNSTSGVISATPDSELTFRYQSADPMNPNTAIFKNDGQIVLGTPGLPASDGAGLFLDSSDINGNGTGTTFKLAGAGSLAIYGSEGGITGVTGTESLINDTNHTIIAGAGADVLVSNLASFVNNGTIQVGDKAGAASLTFDTGTASANAAVFSNAVGGNINVGVGGISGSVLVFQNTQNGSASFNNDGTITLNNAALQFNEGNGINVSLTSTNGTGQLILNGNSSISSFYSGGENLTNGAGHTITNNGTGTISFLGSFTNNGTVNVAAGSLEISTNNPQFMNTGTVTVGTAPVEEQQNVTRSLFGTSPGVVMTVDGSMMNSGNVTVYSGASLNVNGVSDDNGGYTGTYTQTGGTTNIEAGGVLSINTDEATFDLEGGDLTGGGELDANLDQTGGTLNPGDPQSFTIDGNYTLDQGGGLDFDLAGLGTGQYDQVMIGGSVSIDPNAELMVNIEPGFTAQAGDLFTDVLSWQSGGAPNLLSYNDSALGLVFSLVQDGSQSNELDLLVSSSTSATPEPGTLSLFFGTMLIGGAGTWRIRRRRSGKVN